MMHEHPKFLSAQAERSRIRSEGGLGIGLALVKPLTELHGGTVDVSSTPGVGSEFIVRLPLEADPNSLQSQFPVDEPIQTTPPSSRVLIVDDNEDMARMLQLTVESVGHHVRVA